MTIEKKNRKLYEIATKIVFELTKVTEISYQRKNTISDIYMYVCMDIYIYIVTLKR